MHLPIASGLSATRRKVFQQPPPGRGRLRRCWRTSYAAFGYEQRLSARSNSTDQINIEKSAYGNFGVEDPEAVDHCVKRCSYCALGIEDWLRGWRDLDRPSLMAYRGHWVNARRSSRGQVACGERGAEENRHGRRHRAWITGFDSEK